MDKIADRLKLRKEESDSFTVIELLSSYTEEGSSSSLFLVDWWRMHMEEVVAEYVVRKGGQNVILSMPYKMQDYLV